MPITSTCSCS
uniref:Uncharacterized protein n=1 Tax=Rhizophora mucronata TaxID=61149 RepID=A0A2P2PBT6_RHIMU